MLTLTLITLGLAFAAVAWTAVFLSARAYTTHRDRNHDKEINRMRPLALAVVEDEEAPDVSGLTRGEVDALATLIARYGRQLRGDARERLSAFFLNAGLVDRERRELRARNAWRRATAAFALGDMAAMSAVPDLLVALDDRDRAVRMAAARSLGLIGASEAADPIVESVTAARIPWLVGGQALLDIGPTAAPALRAAADDVASPARARAIELLGFVGDAADARSVLDALASESPDIRERGARAIGRLGARDAVVSLRRLLDDPVPAVAAAAASSLAALGDRAAVPDLVRLARDGAFEAARAAAAAAVAIDPRAVDEAARLPGAGAFLGEAADLAALR